MPTASASFSPLTRSLVAIATAVFLASGVFVFAQYAFADQALTFTTAPSTAKTNTQVGFVVQASDASGFTVNLSDGGNGGLFYDASQTNGCTQTTAVQSVTIAVSTKSKAFCYANATPGTYTITASANNLVDAVSSITVTDNHAPVANDNIESVTENTSLNGQLKATDSDSDTLTYATTSDPTHGTITTFNAQTGAYTYAPDIDYTGPDSFEFVANDGTANSNAAKIAIDVMAPAVTPASVTAKDFGTWDDSPAFKGINVGFMTADFTSVSGITVDIYSGSTLVAENTASAALINDINTQAGGFAQNGSLSSPFVISGTLNDTSCAGGPCWTPGTYTWTSSTVPTKAVITVTGTDGNGAATQTAEQDTFTQGEGTFASFFPLPVEDTTQGTYFSTIQAAVNAANAGDVITASAGTYPENITIDTPLTLEGANSGVAGNGTRGSESEIAGTVTVNTSNVKIDGFTLNPTSGSSVLMQGAYTGETVENNIIDDNGYAVNFNTGDTAISNNKIVYGASFSSGVEANSNPAGDLTFTNNVFSGNGANSPADITVIGATNPQTKNVTVENNQSTSGTTLIALFNTDTATISGNTASGANASVIYIGGNDSNITITDNTVSNSTTAINIANIFNDGPNSAVNAATGNVFTNDANGVKVGAAAYTAGSAVNATDNWWGDVSGPTDSVSGDGSVPDTNPSGTGAAAIGAVEYGSWCDDAACTPVTPTAPENVDLTQNGVTYACGTYFNGNSSVYGTHLNWTLPVGETETEYKVVPTYPSGSHGTAYTWTSGTSVWIGANIDQGYGAAPNDQRTYSYSITYKDLLGNWSNPSICAFVYDTVAPMVSVTPDANAALSGVVTFNITINDANAATSSNDAIYVYLYNTQDNSQKYGQKVDLSSGTGTFTVDTTKLTDGSYDLDVGIVKDAAGNPSGTKDNYFDGYTIANGTPTPTNMHFIYQVGTVACGSAVNTTYNNSIQFVWDDPVTEPHHRTLITYPDGTTKMAYTDSRNVWMSKTNYGDNGFGNAAGEKGNGVYTYQVQAENAAGQWSDMAPACTIALDTQSPKANFDPVPPEYVNGNFSVSGDASDNVALKSVFFDVRDPNAKGNQWVAGCVAGTQTTTWGAASTTAQTSCTINTKNLTEGYPYILRIHAGDYAGYGSAGAQQTLILDTTRPNATITAPADNSTQTGTFVITGTATDTLSGIDHVNIYVSKVVAPNAKGSTFGGYVVDDQAATWDAVADTFSYDVSGLADGTYVIKADAFDKAGNDHFASPSPTITVQNVAPIYVTTDAPTDITFSDAELNGANGDSDATGHSFWVSNSTIDTSSPNIPAGVYSTPDFGAISANTSFNASLSSLTSDAVISGGVHGTMPAITPDTTYHYVAWSDVGGTWHPGIEQMFTTSLETPTITSPFDGESTTTTGWQSITWTATPSTNGPVTYVYQVSNTSDATSSDGSFTNVLLTMPGLTSTTLATPNTPAGTYYLHVMAVDAAGNTSAWSPTVEVIVDNSGSGSGGGTTPLTYTFATTTVTIGNLNGWTESDTAGGAVAFLPDSNAPIGNGALELTTTADNNSVTHFTHSFDIPLSDLSAISFNTKQLSAADTTNGNITLRVNVNLDGTSDAVDDQLMYEPYYNGFNGTTMTGWNAWNIASTTGKFWSNENLTYNGLGGVSAGSYASNFTLADVLHDHPNAKIVGLVLSMGTWNPSQTVLADALLVSELDGTNASTTVFDFEPRTGTMTAITNANDLQDNASTAGDPVTVEWNVASVSGKGTPTGTVTVYVNGSSASGCTADVSDGQCSFTPSSSGSVEIYAQYNGDGTFDQSDTKSSTLTHTVNAAGGSNNGGNSGGSGGSNGSPIGNSLIGDINGDGHVDFLDFALLMSAMGEKGTGLPADLDNNGSVGIDDLAIFFANWKI